MPAAHARRELIQQQQNTGRWNQQGLRVEASEKIGFEGIALERPREPPDEELMERFHFVSNDRYKVR